MTIKRKRIYEIALIACCCVIIALTAYMGITAIQKSMKLNLSFTASPVVYCQMKIGEELIFDNLSSQIGDGVENLSGNTLTFNQGKLASTIGVESFSLTLKNYEKTGSSILVEFQNATISGKTGYSEIIASGNSSTFAVTPLNLVGISMTKVTPVTLSLGAGVTLTSSNILTSTSGAQCLPFGEDLQATISLESSYENPKFTLNGNTYEIANNQLTIPAEDLTGGDVSVEVEAEQQGYIITLHLNGGSYNSSTNNVILSGYSALPTTISQIPTRDNHTFAGWYSDVIATTDLPTTQTQYYSYSYLTDSPTLTQTTTKVLNNSITLHARWLPYTINTYASGHVWAGYKYITFENNSTCKANVSVGGDVYDMNWIIIGANDNTNLGKAVSSDVAKSEIPSNHVLLFSQYALFTNALGGYSSWSESFLQGYLNDDGNSNFMAQSGLSVYANYIKSDNTINSLWNGANDVATNQSLFILAYKGASANQSFLDQTYLGTSYSDARYVSYEGWLADRGWWLRSAPVWDPDLYGAIRVYFVSSGGTVDAYSNRSYGVRPCFVLNLA